MPDRPLQHCLDCGALVRAARCPAHTKAYRVQHKKTGRPGVNYGRAWRKFRRAWLSEHPSCVICDTEGVLEPATDVDHVFGHDGTYRSFWDGPFQSLCKRHHSAKTAREVGIA